jgi:flavin-binding protein dodecin
MAARQTRLRSGLSKAFQRPFPREVAAVATYKLITVAGTSPDSFAKAAETAVKTASKSLRGLGWFEVKEMRGRIQKGKISEYQVMVEIGFKLE